MYLPGPEKNSYDVVVIGAGPNGLAAAVILARAGLDVLVLEAEETVGGGARTCELGLADGVTHDVCSAVHPLAVSSPFFREFDLEARGVRFHYPEVSYAQPLDDRRAGVAYRDLRRTAEELEVDGAHWLRIFQPLTRRIDDVVDLVTTDWRSVPRDLLTATRFGLRSLVHGSALWNSRWRSDIAPALLMGVAAHVISPLPSLPAAGTALSLGALAHTYGWPLPKGGSQAIIDALVTDLRAHSGTVITEARVTSFHQLPQAQAYVFDTTPRALLEIVGDRFPIRYRRTLERFRYGNAASKVDFALSGPVPWADPRVAQAGTVHVGGSREHMARAETAVAAGHHTDQPMVLVSDPAVVDPDRIVHGIRPLWSYAHVPAGSSVDVGDAVQAQIERFAPGFSDVVVDRVTTPASAMSGHNANYVDGDIAAGAMTMRQVFGRPTFRPNPYATALPDVFLCSASTPPGPAVHGMGGWHAARRVLSSRFGIRQIPPVTP